MSPASDPIQFLLQEIAHSRRVLLHNSLYQRLHSLADLRRFMEHHVFAVWDFMSLLKALQRNLTCVAVPWLPPANATACRLINEIVLEEESDLDPQGQPISHFGLYLRAMEECGANTGPIRRLLAVLAGGGTLAQALAAAQVPPSVRQFVEHTFSLIESGQTHALAAAFTFGREDLIPAMFRQFVGELHVHFPGQLDTFTYYLNRHIELDEEVHTPLAQQMVRELCGDDPQCWQECQQVAIACMEARMVLWDGVLPVAAALRAEA